MQDLPVTVGKLKMLANLNVDRNRLAVLPSEVWQCVLLFHLYFVVSSQLSVPLYPCICTLWRPLSKSLTQKLSRLWNSLPVDTRNAATLYTFKKKLKTYVL